MSIFDRSIDANVREPAFFSLQIAEARRFFDETEPTGSLRVVGGGVERCAADYQVRRSGFPYVGVEFVARGSGRLSLGKRKFSLVPGMLFAYDKSVQHEITSEADDPLVKYFIDITGPRGRSLLKDAGLSPGQVSYSLSPQSILPIFDELIRSGLETTGPRAARCRAALFEALTCRIGDTRVGAPKKRRPPARSTSTFAVAVNWIGLPHVCIRSVNWPTAAASARRTCAGSSPVSVPAKRRRDCCAA
ncbi:MAG: AraC family ligand binding domain-containing protein [Tepidisphaeraceae bacterium]